MSENVRFRVSNAVQSVCIGEVFSIVLWLHIKKAEKHSATLEVDCGAVFQVESLSRTTWKLGNSIRSASAPRMLLCVHVLFV